MVWVNSAVDRRLAVEQVVDGAAADRLGHFDAAFGAFGPQPALARRRARRSGPLPPIAAERTSCGIVRKPMSLTKAFGASQPMIGPLMKL